MRPDRLAPQPALRFLHVLAAMIAAVSLLVMACGDDSPAAATPSPSPTAPAPTATSAASPSPTPTSPASPTPSATASPTMPGPTPTVTPTPAPGVITSASLVRDILLDLSARVAWDPSREDGGFIPVAQARYPGIRFVSAGTAQANAISFFFGPADQKSPVSATNPSVFAFAVLDSSGTCGAGAISGNPVPQQTEKITLDAGQPCTGLATLAQLSKRLR